ncbi:arylsulfotransferase family protein [Ketobacter sp.]|uniref:arylsulfotransferase family protein n=1 Tax=Ketobacter sp. TaxID=2083498 RepID=UPI000F1484E8|nr:arylsulfotransferase family protein [Ketobacter sp.]RLU00927.1 MAG: hypothetical protein D9N14_04420 [Ketobacter sp.]
MKSGSHNSILNWIPRIMFLFALVFISVIYGMYASLNRTFPYYTLIEAAESLRYLMPENKSLYWFYIQSPQTETITVKQVERMAPGLTKTVTVEGDHTLAVTVIDADANPVQSWSIQWWDIWPEPPAYLYWIEIPKDRPGTHIHGAEILSNGDLVFNFEHLGLVRLDACGNVVWRLPYRTHHSVFIDDDETIWVSAQRNHTQPDPDLPLYKPNFVEPMILQVAADGQILQEKSVFDLLRDNNLDGALYQTSLDNWYPYSQGDTLHLNDVEVFSRDLQPGHFVAGDIMISLRNTNTVLVFDRHWQLKYSLSNEFVRQHDPDFLDGNRISVFDNHNTSRREDGDHPASRILVKDVSTNLTTIPYQGTKQQLFFTNIMGKHQWLDNGNLLISESRLGRALEVDRNGEIVWEMYNVVEPGWLGIMEEVERLPPEMNGDFFGRARQQCEAS